VEGDLSVYGRRLLVIRGETAVSLTFRDTGPDTVELERIGPAKWDWDGRYVTFSRSGSGLMGKASVGYEGGRYSYRSDFAPLGTEAPPPEWRYPETGMPPYLSGNWIAVEYWDGSASYYYDTTKAAGQVIFNFRGDTLFQWLEEHFADSGKATTIPMEALGNGNWTFGEGSIRISRTKDIMTLRATGEDDVGTFIQEFQLVPYSGPLPPVGWAGGAGKRALSRTFKSGPFRFIRSNPR
jgi:hypothetical protein